MSGAEHQRIPSSLCLENAQARRLQTLARRDRLSREALLAWVLRQAARQERLKELAREIGRERKKRTVRWSFNRGHPLVCELIDDLQKEDVNVSLLVRLYLEYEKKNRTR